MIEPPLHPPGPRFSGLSRRAFLAAALVLLPATASLAAVGDLTADGCIEQTGGIACGSTTPGLEGAVAVAVSPDDQNAYVASFNGNSLVVFLRNPDGSLTPAGCFQHTGGIECDGSGGDTPALSDASDVAVSPDGKNVYVVSGEPGAIAIFDRAIDGSLAAAGCIEDSGFNSMCAGIGGNTPAMRVASAVVVSLDGANVYVASFFSDAVVRFTRDSEDGSLTPAGCIQNTGRTDCTNAGGTTTTGLDGAYDLAISADGDNLYVVSYVSDAIVTFDVAPDGALTPESCIQNTGRTECPLAGGSTTPALNGPRAVTVSPDGDNVYVAAYEDDAVLTFDRGAGGTLTADGCIQHTGGTDCAGLGGTAPGLNSPSGLVVSPDGANLYVASLNSDALVIFDRAGDGEITFDECIQDTGLVECANAGGTTTAGLNGAIDVTTSVDGTNVYVASFTGSAVVVFEREVSGTTTTTNTTTSTTSTTNTTTTTTTSTTTSTTNTTTTSTTTTTTTVPETTTTSTTVPETTTTTTPPDTTTTTTLPDDTTTTTLPPETTTTTILPPDTTTTTVADPPTTTTTVPDQTTTTTLPDGTTTTTLPEPTTTTVPDTTTTTVPDTTTTTLEPRECGDVTGDGDVNATDALGILKAAVGGNQCDFQPCKCDAAGGGSINTTDARRTLQLAVGLAVVLLCPC